MWPKSKKLEKALEQVSELTEELDNTKNDVAVLKGTIATQNEQLESKDEEIKKLKAEITAISKKADANFKIMAAKNVKIAELQKTNKSLIMNNKRLSQAVDKFGDMQCKMNNSLIKNTETLSVTFDTLKEMKRENGETIRARFTEISKLTAERVYSHPITFAGSEWKVFVCKRDDYLALFLNWEGINDDKNSCSVFAEFQLISHKSEEIIYRKGAEQEANEFPHDECSNWGYKKFMSFKDLFDEEKGYVKDDSILVAVMIKAFPSAPSN